MSERVEKHVDRYLKTLEQHGVVLPQQKTPAVTHCLVALAMALEDELEALGFCGNPGDGSGASVTVAHRSELGLAYLHQEVSKKFLLMGE